jgi:Flp pilus assembly protein TadG
MKRGVARREAGAAAAEFVLVLPLLLMAVLAVIDWGYYFSVREIAIHAAREGARTASLLDNDTADGVVRANQFLAAARFCTNGAAPGVPAAGGVAVQVTCGDTVLTKFFPEALVPRTLTVSAEIRHE